MAEKACRQNITQFEAQRSEISLSFHNGAKVFLKLWKFYSLFVFSNFLPVNSFLTGKKWSHVMIKSRCLKIFLIYVLMDIFFESRSKLVRIHVSFWPYCVSLGSNDSCHVLFELTFCWSCKEKKRNCSNVNNEQMLQRKSNFKLKIIQLNSSRVELCAVKAEFYSKFNQ